MPKLPCVSGTKVAKALERLGFERQRQRGRHLIGVSAEEFIDQL